MEYTKLEAFLLQVNRTRDFFDGLAPKESLNKFTRLSDYTGKIFSMFNEVPSELDKNLNLCTTPFQKDSIIEHYYSSLSPSYKFFTVVWDFALSKGKVDSTGYREQNYISDEQVKELLEGINQMGRWIEEIKPKEQTDKEETKNAHTEKIKWLGSPEQFGFLFGELAAKGYIELPTKGGEGAISKLAELSLMFFEIQPTKGKNVGNQTTLENLERALNPETNQLSLKGKTNLKLPPLKDLK